MSMPAIEMNPPMTLKELLRPFADAPAVPVTGIASDSRLLQPGFLFLACQGETSHGLDFLSQARDAGVVAVAWDSATAEPPEEIGVPLIAIQDLAGYLGDIANRFYGSPSQHLRTIGVTGTNGKTTVAWLLRECLMHLDRRCAYIGTVGAGLDDVADTGGLTTPAVIEMHAGLADFVAQGASHAAIEVSSHALLQGRIAGMEFEAALFTNLTRDHLDYHGDMQAYFASKAALFTAYPSRHQLINIDSEYGRELAALCGDNAVRVSTRAKGGEEGSLFVVVRSARATEHGSEIVVDSSWGDGKIALPLAGEFNVANAVLVLAYLLSSGVDIAQACDVLALVSAPPGRMQKIPVQGGPVYVDYAHTPDALASALTALRPHCAGKLWCVFGCGGDRDKGKRPEMGNIAGQLADYVVVTTDNPRHEEPARIIDDILAGFENANTVTVIEDRAAAIAWAIANAGPADVVLIAGKGHEAYQEVAGERHPFSDAAVAEAAAAAREIDL